MLDHELNKTTKTLNSELIKLQGIDKIYKQGEVKVQALNAVSLTIKKGEFTVIAGPSGSGKTTLLNIMGGLDIATRGEASLCGVPIKKMSQTKLSNFRKDNIGFIFQSFNLIPPLTAEENIEYIMVLQKVSKKERKKRVKEILKDIGLEDMEKRKPFQLSGGQQQRVAIARAMVARPSIILADEPTANVDSHTAVELIDLMHKLNIEKKMTFLFSTHDNMIIQRATRVIYVRDGKIFKEENRK